MTRIVIALAALVFAGWAGSAEAQTMSYRQAGALIAQSCGPSIEKYCGKVNIGSGQVMQCLNEHQADVPPQCFADYQRVVASIQQRAAAQAGSFKACSADVAEFCGGVQPGDANILDCLLGSSKVVRGVCKQTLIDAGWQ
jgi:hypothetical protein